MPLKMNTKTVIKVYYSDLEEFVNETYGFEGHPMYKGSTVMLFPYSFVATEKCDNDTDHEFLVDGYVDEWAEIQLKQWKDHHGGLACISNHTILDDLCRQGLIPEGTYLISVSW